MKILTGELRGREIAFKANPNLRPTADKVRKAIFDALGDAVQGASVLDLFAGTGALGLEALSGGAARAIFVEENKTQASQIKKNLDALGLAPKAEVICLDALKAIRNLSRKGEAFNLIFLDPPYHEGWELQAAGAVAVSPIFSKACWAVMESAAKAAAAPAHFGPLAARKEKIYGDTRVVFYG